MMIERCIMATTRCVCLREVQKSIKESVKRLLEDKIQKLGVGSEFEVLETEIRNKRNGSFIIFQGMLSHTAESIKSLEGYDIAWVEEAQSISAHSLRLLRPTIRKETAEIWFSWNPLNEDSAVDQLLRGPQAIRDAIVVEANYLDNPFCPDVMKNEAKLDKERDYDNFLHVWMGHYKRTLDGSIYAKELRAAYEEKRVTTVKPIAGKPVETFWDLGHRDHTAIWFAQLQMGEYRILKFYQNRGERLEHYAQVVRDAGYPLGTVWLPHDAKQERVNADTVEQSLRALLPNTLIRVVPRMAKKMHGIEAGRKIFPQCYFDETECKEGLKALARYRYDVDEDTGAYSLNPLHDEYSDGADAFAQLALSLNETKPTTLKGMPGAGAYGMRVI
jgi:phage terminase large subunit